MQLLIGIEQISYKYPLLVILYSVSQEHHTHQHPESCLVLPHPVLHSRSSSHTNHIHPSIQPQQGQQVTPVFIQSQFGTILNQRYLQKTRPRAVAGTGVRYRNSNIWFGRLRDRVRDTKTKNQDQDKIQDVKQRRRKGRRSFHPLFEDLNKGKPSDINQYEEFTSNDEPMVEELPAVPIDLTSEKSPMKNVDLLTVINTSEPEDKKPVKDQVTNSVRRKRKSILFPVSKGGVVSQRYYSPSSPVWCDITRSQGAWMRFTTLDRRCKG